MNTPRGSTVEGRRGARPTARAVSVALTTLAAFVFFGRLTAQAQSSPSPAAVAPPALPGASAAAQLPGMGGAGGAGPAGAPVLMGQLGEGQASIVGGNVASARERALTDAFKRAVDTSVSALVPDVRASQPKTVIQVLGRARSFVRRYRTLEEGELVRGSYVIRIDAEIDDAALRRAFDRSLALGGGGAASSPSVAGAPTSYLVASAGSPDAVDAVTRRLTASGARVHLATAAEGDAPGRLVESAARAQMSAVAFVSATATTEGRVRGPGLESVACSLGVRILSAGTGLAQADESEAARSFAVHEESARRDCFERAAAAVVGRIAPPASAETVEAADLRTITIDADVIEPAAVLGMLKQLRALAMVSAVDLRRVAAGRAELRVRARLPGAALFAILARDSVALDWGSPDAAGDLVKVRVRVRQTEPVSGSPASPAGGGSAAGTAPPAAGVETPP